MKAAIIDMGTNTFHLLAAQWNADGYEILLRERIPVRVGVGGINRDIITYEGMDRAVHALIQFKERITNLEVTRVFAFGTSAIRNAKNGPAVISKIKEATGIEAKIISGDEEAQYIYEGVNLALKLGHEKSLIIDIGGGSVEFIIGNGTQVFWKQSFEVGAQRLLERFQKHDPITTSEIDSVFDFLRLELTPLFDAMKIHGPKILAGSSGTFDTLSDIYCIQSGIPIQELPETPLTIAAFSKIYPEIISKTRAQRLMIPGMIEMRVDMIVVACCLLKLILDSFYFDQIRVSSFSLKEGVLASLINKKF